MIDWLIYWRGCWRIYWGFCPVCNSDAPLLDNCKFCGSFRGWRDKTARRDMAYSWDKETNNEWRRYWA